MDSKSIRRLVAIMFTDIQGYTKLMQNNEQHANDIRKIHKKILEKHIIGNKGEILQYYGDGSLSIFISAVSAVKAAILIQKELQNKPKIPLRIGIHTGDVVHDSDGIYGDGVNIASRIENLSTPGGVLISEKLFDEIKNHSEFTTLSLGDFELKNVKHPIGIFAITNEGLSVPDEEEMRAGKKNIHKSIAVLPFLNMSSDPENEYFSDGISEEIINLLTKIDGLNVTARTSSFAFKGKDQDIRTIGEKLNVKNVLEGSVRKSKNMVRITAQLINTSDGFHIFSEVYDRELKDIFAVQDEISLLITNKMKENLNRTIKGSLKNNPPAKNLNAYDLYLKGLHSFYKGSFQEVMNSEKFFIRSIEIEPDFVLPFIALSRINLYLGTTRFLDPQIANKKAEEYALRSIEIDKDQADSYVALANVYLWHKWNMKEAENNIKKAIRLNPGLAYAHHINALFLVASGKLDDALIEAEISKNLDPLSLGTDYVLGVVYYCREQFTDAIEYFNKTLKKVPQYQQAVVLKAKAYLLLRDAENALLTFKPILKDPNLITLNFSANAQIHALNGEQEKIINCLEEIKKQEISGKTKFLNWSYTLVYMALDQTDKMFEYLEKSIIEKTATLIFLKVDPQFKKYRDEPEFKRIIKQYYD